GFGTCPIVEGAAEITHAAGGALPPASSPGTSRKIAATVPHNSADEVMRFIPLGSTVGLERHIDHTCEQRYRHPGADATIFLMPRLGIARSGGPRKPGIVRSTRGFGPLTQTRGARWR